MSYVIDTEITNAIISNGGQVGEEVNFENRMTRPVNNTVLVKNGDVLMLPEPSEWRNACFKDFINGYPYYGLILHRKNGESVKVSCSCFERAIREYNDDGTIKKDRNGKVQDFKTSNGNAVDVYGKYHTTEKSLEEVVKAFSELQFTVNPIQTLNFKGDRVTTTNVYTIIGKERIETVEFEEVVETPEEVAEETAVEAVVEDASKTTKKGNK